MTPAEKRKIFLARWIPYGLKKLSRAEEYGIPWDKLPIEKLEGQIVFAEEFSAPEPVRE
jgi:hypothetical protein